MVPLGSESKPRRGSKTSKRASIAISSTGMDLDEPLVKIDLERSFNISLQTLNVTDLDFLPPPTSSSLPAIAIVYSDHLGKKVLQSHTLDLAQMEFTEGPIADLTLADPGSESFISVPGGEMKEAGVVVIGEESLRWVGLPRESDVKGKGKGGEDSVECSMPVGMIQA